MKIITTMMIAAGLAFAGPLSPITAKLLTTKPVPFATTLALLAPPSWETRLAGQRASNKAMPRCITAR